MKPKLRAAALILAAMVTTVSLVETVLAQNQPPGPSSDSIAARIRLEGELRTLEERLDQLRRELTVAGEVLVVLQRVDSSVRALEPGTPVAGAVTSITTRFAEVMRMAPDARLTSDSIAFQDIMRAMNILRGDLYVVPDTFGRELDTALRIYGRESREYAKYEALTGLTNLYSTDETIPEWYERLADISYEVSERSDLTRGLLNERLEALRAQVEGFTLEQYTATFTAMQQSVQQLGQNAVARVQAEQARLAQEIASVEEAIVTTSTELEEAITAQTAIDKNLTYAIWGMIIVLVLLFLSLRLFTENIATQLIEKRSLVEVLSMAFMLLTIIILGTGGKIGGETLGTLLGMIAGYIFGRRIGEPPGGK